MRGILSWFLLFGVLFGLQARIIGVDPCEVVGMQHCSCDAGGQHDSRTPCDCPHDDGCPSKEHHHHHGLCSHASPLTAENDVCCAPLSPVARLARMTLMSDRIPEGPYLALDQPPII